MQHSVSLIDLGLPQPQPTLTLPALHLQFLLCWQLEALQSIFVSGAAELLKIPVLLQAPSVAALKDEQQVPELVLALGPSTFILLRLHRPESQLQQLET